MKLKRLITDRQPMETENTLWEQQEIMRILSNRPGTAYQEADDENREIFRQWVRQVLLSQEITIEFVKSDGSMRTMRCTLAPDLIKIAANKTQSIDGLSRTGHRPGQDPGTQVIWDLDQEQWRSFRYDRLRKISFSIGL
jgi:hypothetical protein